MFNPHASTSHNDQRIDEFDSMPENNRNREGNDNSSVTGAFGTGSVESEQATLSTTTDLLGTMLSNKWKAWSNSRTEQEDRWLKNIRQFKSIYEPWIALRIGTDKSRIYLQITKKKVLESYAHQINTFFPGSGIEHWSIKSTPTLEVENQIQTPEAKEQLDDIVKANTKKMIEKIKGQLVEADYPSLFRSAVLDSTKMGTGIVASGEMDVINDKIVPKIRRINPFDGYPDPDATIAKSMSGFFERMIISRKEFKDLSLSPGFDKDRINEIILQNSKGNHIKLTWEHERENASIKKNELNIERIRFEVLKFDGYLNGMDFKEAGFDVLDENLTVEYRAEVWISSNLVIKSAIELPEQGERLPYNIFPHLKDEDQLNGMGFPETMDDSQDMINAGARRLIDDLATSGTIHEIALEALTPASQKTANEIYNGKIYFTNNQDLAFPVVRSSKIPTMSAELMSVIAMFRRFIDDESNAPSQGSGFAPTGAASAARTAAGLSILKGEADIIKNTPIKNIDDYLIVPMIKSLYDFNMKWYGHEFAGGLDVKVKALGSKSLLTKEIQNAQMINLLNVSNNDRDANIVKRAETYADVVEAMGQDPEDRINTPEEIAKLTRNPQREKVEALEIEKLVLENELISKEINNEEAKTLKELSAVGHDKEILRQSGVKLRAEILAGIEDRKDKKALSSTTKNEVRRDGLKTNNRDNS